VAPTTLAAAAAVLWTGILLAPWRPWSTRERLDGAAGNAAGNGSGNAAGSPDTDCSDITALIPARDEAAVIGNTIAALKAQGTGLTIVVIDDQSEDGTADIARTAGGDSCTVIAGSPMPAGWVGKMWALEQGRHHVRTPLTLLLDADIELLPGILAALLARRRLDGRQFLSLMAVLEMGSVWDKLLVPAFVYFFKLLYPFRISNSPSRLVAAAAGGCVLVETGMLQQVGGFVTIRDELIDDCALARRIKSAGGRTWIGMTHSAISRRQLGTLRATWHMVARSAFAQLQFSALLLACCVALLAVAFWVAPLALIVGPATARWLAATATGAMIVSYIPVLRFYGRSPLWAFALPVTGTLYLMMTVSSALHSWRGIRATWKGRTYGGTVSPRA
jgi:hopene-associated glycosyltransferase HpnB